MPMSAKQRRHLRSLAHHLKPVVMLGQSGLTPAVLAEVGAGLEHHELIKVKINTGDRVERKALAEKIRDHAHAELIHSIGHMAVFYRANPRKKSPLLAAVAP